MRDEPSTLLLAVLALIAVLTGGCVQGLRTVREDAPTPPEPRPPSNVTWWDPVESQWWVLGDRTVTWQDAHDACAKPYALPTIDQLRAVRARGVCKGLEVCPLTWSKGVARDTALTFDLDKGTSATTPKTQAVAVAYCVETKA